MRLNNKKGFTLPELLAIIVVLGIIVVITVPKMVDSIQKSRKNAAIVSAFGYKDAIYVSVLSSESRVNIVDNSYKVRLSDGSLVYGLDNGDPDDDLIYKVSLTGKKPDGGVVTIYQGEVTEACLTFGAYSVSIVNDKVANVDKGEC